jgi:hypothetical protein
VVVLAVAVETGSLVAGGVLVDAGSVAVDVVAEVGGGVADGATPGRHNVRLTRE